MLVMRANREYGFTSMTGIGGIGAGIVYALDGGQELSRNESRLGKLLESRDYCKLHIVSHYVARLMGAGDDAGKFQVRPIGVIGFDGAGSELLAEMTTAGMDTRFVRRDSVHRTMFSVCFLYPDGSGGNITSSNSAASTLRIDDLEAAQPSMLAAGARGIALCVPEVPIDLRREFLLRATQCGNYRVCSFTREEMGQATRMGLVARTDLLALNHEEALALFGDRLGRPLTPELLAERAMRFTRARQGLRLVVSAGAAGAWGFQAGMAQFCPALPLNPVSTAGAGDALLAGVLSGLAAEVPFIEPERSQSLFSGKQVSTALELGVLNAAFSVTSMHTIHPEASIDTLEAFAQVHGASLAAALPVVSLPGRAKMDGCGPPVRMDRSVGNSIARKARQKP
jgi:sugar/nucleoside kinase (ribokinase family)